MIAIYIDYSAGTFKLGRCTAYLVVSYVIAIDCCTDWNHTIDPIFQTTT